MTRSTLILPLALLALLFAACGEDADTSNTETPDGVHNIDEVIDGKSDNYIGTNSREFNLTGKTSFELPEDFATLEPDAQTARLDSLAQTRLDSVGRAIRAHIDAILLEVNDGETGEDANYFTYFRRGAGDLESVAVGTDGRGEVQFSIDFVGSVWLMSKIAPEATSRRTFEVEVKNWPDPEGEVVEVEIKGSESRDAFPKYNELFADGVYDIAIHFGGDYNEGRFDIETAKWTVATLIEGGWDNPGVEGFEDLTIDSAPFTRKLVVEGNPVEARVYIYHSDMVDPSAESELSEAMKTSFAERDIIIYSGHAGEGAGFILDYQPRHQISASEFKNLPMADKYQIFILDGCRTYRTYVDDLMENPNKTFNNVDIVTTVNTTPFTVGYQLIHEFLYWFTLTDEGGNHFPISWQAILRGLNTQNFDNIYYGVHGIDEDPRLNPHASEGFACKSCTSDADCGAGGNFCLGFSGGAACGVACTTDTACGEGNRCARLWDDPELFYLPKQCVPRDYVCQ